jgi:hypothetical protein
MEAQKNVVFEKQLFCITSNVDMEGSRNSCKAMLKLSFDIVTPDPRRTAAFRLGSTMDIFRDFSYISLESPL